MSKQPQPVLYKSFFQLKFKPKLRFFDAMFTKLDRVEEDFGDWQTSGSVTTLINYQRRFSLMLRLDLLQFESDSGQLDDEATGIKDALTIAKEHFAVKSIERIDLRRCYLVPIEDMDFSSLVSLMNVKLFTQATSLRKALPGSAKDLAYHRIMRDGTRDYALLAGPLRRNEVPKFLQFNANMHLKPDNRALEHAKVLDSYPNMSLLCDIHYYQEDPKPRTDELDAFVGEAKQRVQEVADNFVKYILQEKME